MDFPTNSLGLWEPEGERENVKLPQRWSCSSGLSYVAAPSLKNARAEAETGEGKLSRTSESSRGRLELRRRGLALRVSDSAGLGQGLESHCSGKFPSDADVPDPGTILYKNPGSDTPQTG